MSEFDVNAPTCSPDYPDYTPAPPPEPTQTSSNSPDSSAAAFAACTLAQAEQYAADHDPVGAPSLTITVTVDDGPIEPGDGSGAQANAADGFSSNPSGPDGTAPAAGVEFGVTAQLGVGFDAKAGYFVDADGGSYLTLSANERLGYAVGATVGFDGVVSPGGMQNVGGYSVTAEVDAGIATGSVSQSLGHDGPQGTPYVTVSPPGSGIGMIGGVSTNIGGTLVVPVPITGPQAAAVMDTIPLP
jgi:hypothetical protein